MGDSNASRGDTGEAIIQAYTSWLYQWKQPENGSLTLQEANAEARTALQELIRGEVVKARHDEIKQLDNVLPDLWEKGNLTLGDMTRLMSYIANRDDAIDAALSSGQTDGTA